MKKLNVKKLSVAIRQALDDLRACEKDARYRITMAVFHEPSSSGCAVCFAGAVIAQRLGAPIDKDRDTFDFPEEQMMLYALDSIRQGRIKRALGEIDLECPEDLLDTKAFKSFKWLERYGWYQCNPGKFKRCLSRIAGMLERRGL